MARNRSEKLTMIVCVCEGLSERNIRSAIQSGARSVGELGRRCGAGLDCGRCRAMLRGMLGEGCDARPPEGAAGSRRT
jgi:bacterioferritin-associated ferredoxin